MCTTQQQNASNLYRRKQSSPTTTLIVYLPLKVQPKNLIIDTTTHQINYNHTHKLQN